MSLSIGIVGLPNVGKSTLFNALLKRQVALAANYPFATIEPNVGVVDVPDERLTELAKIVKKEFSSSAAFKSGRNGQVVEVPEKITPAVVKFYDIAGLVKGAAEGAGLGNQFLSHIREVDAIVHVVRAFSDENVVREGAVSPHEDIKIINTELILADLQALEKKIEKHEILLKKEKTAENLKKGEIYQKLKNGLNLGNLAREIELAQEEQNLIIDLNLLTLKPMLYVFNIDESELSSLTTQKEFLDSNDRLFLSAKIESELSSLDENDQKAYLKQLGVEQSGLDKVIKQGYFMLGLHTYFTTGPKEVRAWTIKQGTKAPQAAGVIHTDFERGFIRAEVVSYTDLISAGGFKQAREKGLLRLEGKEYIMHNGDVVEFRFNV